MVSIRLTPLSFSVQNNTSKITVLIYLSLFSHLHITSLVSQSSWHNIYPYFRVTGCVATCLHFYLISVHILPCFPCANNTALQNHFVFLATVVCMPYPVLLLMFGTVFQNLVTESAASVLSRHCQKLTSAISPTKIQEQWLEI